MHKPFNKLVGLGIQVSKSSPKCLFSPGIAASFSSQSLILHQNAKTDFPTKCDVCIIGGGAMGSSTAYWLKQHPAGQKLNVVVIERDPQYTKASTVLSLGGIRQQFSIGENVQLSLFGMQFINKIQEHLGVPGQDPVDVQYCPRGYLFLASNPEGAQILQENHVVQREYDSKVELISPAEVKKRYPFMRTDDLLLASVGVKNEGWFDPWSLLNGFKNKAISLGTQYVTAEVVGFDTKGPVKDTGNVGPTQLHVKDAQGQMRSIEFSQCVVAAGYDSGRVAGLAGIGCGEGALSVPLPVEPKKRYVYYFNTPNMEDAHSIAPLLSDTSGIWFRPSSGSPGDFFTGRCPTPGDEEPPVDDLEVDYSYFDTDVWPHLAHRVKAFENLKVKSAYAGYYDYNTFDQNGVIGTHPVFNNFHIVTGFSGHGIQQSPAAGHSIMELIIHGGFKTIDLTRFGFERFIERKQVLEKNIM